MPEHRSQYGRRNRTHRLNPAAEFRRRVSSSSVTARFGATVNPLADARGSDRSPDRKGGVALQEHKTTRSMHLYVHTLFIDCHLLADDGTGESPDETEYSASFNGRGAGARPLIPVVTVGARSGSGISGSPAGPDRQSNQRSHRWRTPGHAPDLRPADLDCARVLKRNEAFIRLAERPRQGLPAPRADLDDLAQLCPLDRLCQVPGLQPDASLLGNQLQALVPDLLDCTGQLLSALQIHFDVSLRLDPAKVAPIAGGGRVERKSQRDQNRHRYRNLHFSNSCARSPAEPPDRRRSEPGNVCDQQHAEQQDQIKRQRGAVHAGHGLLEPVCREAQVESDGRRQITQLQVRQKNDAELRSEERRVGTECRSRWS